MKYQAVFKRYEIKYMITEEQKQRVLRAIEPYMSIDEYGKTTIRNIYLDTDDYILARHSIARPDFKEKLRIRSYSRANEDSTVFVELKRKYDGIVYKRRVGLAEHEAKDWMMGRGAEHIHKEEPQLSNEIDYFLNMYKELKPAIYLSYDREAYRMNDGSDFRVTFDSNIKARDYDITLEAEAYGTDLLEEDKYLMEIKCSGGIPLWMTKVLSAEKIYKTSFSKYGTAYQSMIFPAMMNENARIYAALESSEKSHKESGKAQHGKQESRQRMRMFGFGRQRATA